MTRYAWIGPGPMSETPILVKAWIDTDVMKYLNMPPTNELLEMTDEQWDARSTMDHIGSAGFVERPIPPAPPPTAADILAGKIAAGLSVTCTGDASVSSTYALDAQTMDQIGSVARDAASGLGLPTGAPTFTYPDLGGIPRTFTADRLISLYKAQRDVLFRVNTAAAILANGGAPSWPDQTATIP